VKIIDIGGGPRRWRYGGVGAAAAALALAGGLTAFAANAGNSDSPATAGSTASAAAARTVGADEHSYAGIVERAAPTVVTVRSKQRATVSRTQALPVPQDPFFRRFFDGEEGFAVPQPRRQSGLGSGVIVRPDGYILTNHHVIDGAEEITVELSDRRSFTATLVGSDPPSDLAVLKIDAIGLPALPLGNSDDVRVGDVVLALGNPMGVGQTVTMGIISAKGRATGLGDGGFEDFLQTDAPINQGNSGGALVNSQGELVGINSQILSPSGGNIGIGFAIPANMAKHVMNALIADGQVQRGMIGVTVQTITPELASSLGLDSVRGALVSTVQAGGPADDAGIRRGDVVTALNGSAVDDSNTLRNQVAQLAPGSTARVTVIRGGQEHTLDVTLAELPSASASNDRPNGSREAGNAGRAGLSVQPVTPDDARRLELPTGAGVMVTNVDPSGPAADAGLQRGDVIEQVDGSPVTSAAELRKALEAAGDRPALVLVHRQNGTLYVPLNPS
jgi:Do/DeqQ family serine protease